MTIPEYNDIVEPNDQTEARREHLEKLRALVGDVYPNKFTRTFVTGAEDTITRILEHEEIKNLAAQIKGSENKTPEEIEELKEELKHFRVRIAGRLAVPPRVMGKAGFVHLSDGVSRLQIYVRRGDFKAVTSLESQGGNSSLQTRNSPDPPDSPDSWTVFGLLDHGDFVGVEGFLFITKTGELTVHVEKLQFLAKAMLPMPDKMHGISDPELRRRHRYADLIASSLKIDHEERELTTREVFEIRAKTISGMRHFLEDAGYIEVETPMLTPKATGAAAKPFETHHNALDITLYTRIAPELYLKRLVVGGFEKVYELNRNFRNEGLSYKHNPEFTMLEFYCAYMDVNGMMDFAEAMIKESVQKATGSLQVKYGENEIDFSKFERLTMRQATIKNLPYYFQELGVDESFVEDSLNFNTVYRFYYEVEHQTDEQYKAQTPAYKETQPDRENFQREFFDRTEYLKKTWESAKQRAESLKSKNEVPNENQSAREIERLFEDLAESKLLQPTFIIDYPKSISPLSKASPENREVAERFELFINGMECANGFSELNDPREQYERFTDQMKERETGDDEAMIMDEDYIRALSYGMPPAAGIGIGIDRLVMLLTNRHSIRDVILFPHMRPERHGAKHEDAEENEAEASA